MQLHSVVMTHNHGSVRVAQDDLSSHVDELVNEEQTALKHFLVDEHCALGLCGYHKHDAQQVWRQSWPRGIGK